MPGWKILKILIEIYHSIFFILILSLFYLNISGSLSFFKLILQTWNHGISFFKYGIFSVIRSFWDCLHAYLCILILRPVHLLHIYISSYPKHFISLRVVFHHQKRSVSKPYPLPLIQHLYPFRIFTLPHSIHLRTTKKKKQERGCSLKDRFVVVSIDQMLRVLVWDVGSAKLSSRLIGVEQTWLNLEFGQDEKSLNVELDVCT